tara:strand:+ start:13008 stop:13934 length:927 start_codon:yes stop_codon:yes gene_type:complete
MRCTDIYGYWTLVGSHLWLLIQTPIETLYLTPSSFLMRMPTLWVLTLKRYFRSLLPGLILLSCSVLLVPASAATLTIAFGEFKPPYIFGREARGLEVDIFREALTYKGHVLNVVHIPDSRRYKALADHTLLLDGAATIGVVGDYFYSDDFIVYQNYVITRKEDGHDIARVEDLQGISVVAWQHAWAELGSTFALLFSPNAEGSYRQDYYENPSQRAQVGMFWRKRVDAVVMDRKIFAWLSGEYLGRTDFEEQVTFHPIFARQTAFKAAFVSEQIRNDFNEGLALLRSSGAYGRLVDAYAKERWPRAGR